MTSQSCFLPKIARPRAWDEQSRAGVLRQSPEQPNCLRTDHVPAHAIAAVVWFPADSNWDAQCSGTGFEQNLVDGWRVVLCWKEASARDSPEVERVVLSKRPFLQPVASGISVRTPRR